MKTSATSELYGGLARRDIGMVSTAIKAGADIFFHNTFFSDPLSSAVVINFPEAVSTLLQNGADPGYKGGGKITALERAEQLGNEEIVKLLKTNMAKKGNNMSNKGIITTEELLKQRGSVYGDPSINLSCCGALLNVEEDYQHLTLAKYAAKETPFSNVSYRTAHRTAIRMCLVKLSRILTGADVHEDNYDDLIGYATIAKNMAVELQRECNENE